MKKVYSAPDIAFQALNVNNASGNGCEFVYVGGTESAEHDCPIKDIWSNKILFSDVCVAKGGYKPNYDVCYGTFDDNANVSGS